AEPAGPPPAPAVPASTQRSGPAAWPEAAVPATPAEPPPSVGVSAPPVVPAGSPAAEAAPGGLDAAAVRRTWPDVLEQVKTRRRTTWALLSQYAQVVEVRGRTLTLSFSTEPIRRQFTASGSDAVLADVLRESLGVDWRIESLVEGTSQEAATGGAGAPAAGGGGGYDSFAPGDDPVDDPADGDAGRSAMPPEEAAIARLQETLGAKVIGEIDTG
ncbi:MAG: hypothetical protein ACJ74O_08365, partial [Frankiaceae bacterium]